LKMVTTVEVLNPRSFRHQFLVLTTRPQILAKNPNLFEQVFALTLASAFEV
jgi:hypothetical protein